MDEEAREGPSDAAIRTAAAGLLLIVGTDAGAELADDLDALVHEADVPHGDLLNGMSYIAHRLVLAMGTTEATTVLRSILFEHLDADGDG